MKSNFEEFVERVRDGRLPESLDAPEPETAAPTEESPKLPDAVYGAHMNGKMLLLNEVEDEAFAERTLGDGVAIEPSEGRLYAPADAEVDTVFDTGHAISLLTDAGTELLLHIGIDTVELGGKHFETHVRDGQRVKKGDLLISFDLDAIRAEGYKVTTPMIVCNTDDYALVRPLRTGEVRVGEDFLEVIG